MNKIKTFVLSREIVLSAALIGIVTVAPLLHSQLVTGTIVNAALFAAVLLAGFRVAATVAVVPSLIALAVGTLPVMLAPMIPYIMASNIALAGIFTLLKKIGYWPAAIAASLSKFVILAISALAVLSPMVHGQISLVLASMMGWSQLVTALIGAEIAYILVAKTAYRKQ